MKSHERGAASSPNWEEIRKSQEYIRYMVIILKRELEKLLFNFHTQNIDAIPDVNDDIDALADAVDINKPLDADQRTVLMQIAQLNTIEEFRQYCSDKNIPFDIDGIVKKMEVNYLENQKRLDALKKLQDKHRPKPN
jgi:hypothetical protein